MSKSGSSAGGASGAGRRGRKVAHGGERGDKIHRTPAQHAAGRRGTDVKTGPNGLTATGATTAEKRKARRDRNLAERRAVNGRKAGRKAKAAAKARKSVGGKFNARPLKSHANDRFHD
jgi:hypothetical protein